MKRKNMKRFFYSYMAVLLLLFSFKLSVSAFDSIEQYVENSWNYVDRSMDISNGIPEDAVGVLARIRETRTLRIATEPYYPPQEFIDPAKIGRNRFAGSDIELAQLIADRMGVTLEIIPMEFTDVLPAVAEGTCDLAISALSFTPSRAMQYGLSKGYYFAEENAGNGILIRIEDRDKYQSVEDFADKVIMAQSGSLQESIMAEEFPKYKEFIRLSTVQDVLKAMESGEADAAMIDTELAESYFAKEPDCGLMLIPGVQFQLEEQFRGDRIAAKKGELQLLYFVNGVIDEVVDSGLYMKWYREAEALAASLGL